MSFSMAEQAGLLFLAFSICLGSVAGLGMMLFRKVSMLDCFPCLFVRYVYRKCCYCRCGCCQNLRKKMEEEVERDDNYDNVDL
jgi:hypothetical protein